MTFQIPSMSKFFEIFYNHIAMQSSIHDHNYHHWAVRTLGHLILRAKGPVGKHPPMLYGNRACLNIYHVLQYMPHSTLYAAFNIICCFQLYIPMPTTYIESYSLWHHHNHPHLPLDFSPHKMYNFSTKMYNFCVLS